MLWVVYILLLNNNALYTGITNNLEKRLGAHSNGKGSKYVRAHLPFRVIYIKEAENRSEASSEEYAIKQLSREAKEKIIENTVSCEECGVKISSLTDSEDFNCMVCEMPSD